MLRLIFLLIYDIIILQIQCLFKYYLARFLLYLENISQDDYFFVSQYEYFGESQGYDNGRDEATTGIVSTALL